MGPVLTPVESPGVLVRAAWSLPADEVLDAVGSGADGLSATVVERRLTEHGPNELPLPPRPPLWRRILSHFQDVLVYVLLVAAGLKAILGEWIDFAVILLVAIVNAAVGLIQEGRAESALDGIRKMLSPGAEVRRDGEWTKV